MASEMMRRARFAASWLASSSMRRTIFAASMRAWFSIAADQLGLGLVDRQPGDALEESPLLGDRGGDGVLLERERRIAVGELLQPLLEVLLLALQPTLAFDQGGLTLIEPALAADQLLPALGGVPLELAARVQQFLAGLDAGVPDPVLSLLLGNRQQMASVFLGLDVEVCDGRSGAPRLDEHHYRGDDDRHRAGNHNGDANHTVPRSRNAVHAPVRGWRERWGRRKAPAVGRVSNSI